MNLTASLECLSSNPCAITLNSDSFVEYLEVLTGNNELQRTRNQMSVLMTALPCEGVEK